MLKAVTLVCVMCVGWVIFGTEGFLMSSSSRLGGGWRIGRHVAAGATPVSSGLFMNNDENGSDDDDDSPLSFSSLPLSEERRSEILANQPTQLQIAKDLLGVNAFTLILVGLIAIVTIANLAFGPGWVLGTNDIKEFGEGVPGDVLHLSTKPYLLY